MLKIVNMLALSIQIFSVFKIHERLCCFTIAQAYRAQILIPDIPLAHWKKSFDVEKSPKFGQKLKELTLTFWRLWNIFDFLKIVSRKLL